ncbi:MAG: hypothetical protein ACI4BA_02800 [Prevotella sp.]
MRIPGKKYLPLAAWAIITACSESDMSSDSTSAAQLEMSLSPQSLTRAHFTDNEGTAVFVWDVGSSMIAAVSNGTSMAQWTDGSYYSPMNISLLDPTSSDKVLGAGSALTIPSDAARVGDRLFYFSPVNGSALCTTVAAQDGVAVTFSMPDVFTQSATGRLEEFEPYCFIHGESTVLSVPSSGNKNFVSNTTRFRSIPATFRFNISNNTAGDVTIESVKITCDRLFPDRLQWRCDAESAGMGEMADKSGYSNTIKTAVNPGYGEVIAAKTGETTSQGTYYAMCLPYDSDADMEGATLAFIVETKEKIHTFNVSASEFFRDAESGHKKFESNRIYTFNITLNENSVELEGVTVSDWQDVPFYYPTEEVSAFVSLNPSYWVQDRHNLYTYGFLKMSKDESTVTLWGECNIGEYLYYATDNLFFWNQVAPSSESDMDYLSDYFDGITDFKWQTPAKADFVRLLSVEENIEMCRDSASGCYGLRVKSSASPGTSIFLPCSYTTKTDYNEEGVTHIKREFHGYYWTRDAVDESNAWLLHFAFTQTETVENETSTFSDFTKILHSGSDLYEFTGAAKNNRYPVRAILQDEEL